MVRAILSKRMDQLNMSLIQLHKLTKINRGTLSKMMSMTEKKSINVTTLDKITEALQRPVGFYYSYYINDCFNIVKNEYVPKKRILEAFLVRCSELGMNNLISKAVEKLPKKNLKIIYEIVDELYADGKEEQSIPFLEEIIKYETDIRSEEFSIIQYRLFIATQSSNSEENLRAAFKFELYYEGLPLHYKIEATRIILNIQYQAGNWEGVEKYADQLIDISTKISNGTIKLEEQPSRALVLYYGYGYLAKSTSLQKRNKFKSAKKLIDFYADLSDFPFSSDPISQNEIAKFSGWAIANNRTLDILLGNKQQINDYVAMLRNHPEEIIAGLLTIVESANKNKFNIDHILEEFEDFYSFIDESYDPNTLAYYENLYNELLNYYIFHKSHKKLIDTSLQMLHLSFIINNSGSFKRSVVLFELNRANASKIQISKYTQIITERGQV